MSPRFELGYRLPQGFGAFLAAFRFLVTEGSETALRFDAAGDGLLSSRLNLNVLDLDYASWEFALGPLCDMHWNVGVRLANVFFDARARGQLREQRASSFFLGAGPHAGLELGRRFDGTGLSLFGRADGAVLIGRITQAFEETLTVADGTVLGGATTQRTDQAVPIVKLQAGLGWTPPGYYLTRFLLGYEIEQWYYLGRLNDSRAELTVQGLFLRGEFSF